VDAVAGVRVERADGCAFGGGRRTGLGGREGGTDGRTDRGGHEGGGREGGGEGGEGGEERRSSR